MTGTINLGRNHPPMVAEVFDPEYLAAQDAVLRELPPSAIAGHHRWTGTARDRAAGAKFAALRLGAEPDPDRVIVTNGTQSALLMLFAGLVGRGGVLLAEALTYPPLMTFARHFGFRIAGVAIDDHGMVPDALEAAVRAEKPGAVYLVPTHQNPTTSIMPLSRREQIAQIARHHGVAIIEDDIYSLLTPDGPPPLSALAPEIGWHVLGTAKSIAAGMKIAYVTCPSPEAARQRFWPGVRGTHWMATPMSAAIMTAMIEGGGAARIMDAVGDEARARQVLAREALGNIPVITQREALHLWFELPPGMRRAALAEKASNNGLIIGTSDEFAVGERSVSEAVRIGIGNPGSRAELHQGLRQFVAAYEELLP